MEQRDPDIKEWKQNELCQFGDYIVLEKASDDPLAQDFPFAVCHKDASDLLAHTTTDNKACIVAYALSICKEHDGRTLFGTENVDQL